MLRDHRANKVVSSKFGSTILELLRKKVILKLILLAIVLNFALSLWIIYLDLGRYIYSPYIDHVSSLRSFASSWKEKKQANVNQGERSRRYLKFDEASLQAIPGSERSHSLPNAVPAHRTIPRHLVEDANYHMARRTNQTTKSITGKYRRFRRPEFDESTGDGFFNWKHNYTVDNRALYLYNPSVLPLFQTASQQDSDDLEYYDPDYLSDTDLDALTGRDPSVRYVVTFRANTGGNCFGPEGSATLMKTGEPQLSYLALALLDSNLDIVPGTDVLIDLNAGPERVTYWRQNLEDCRINLLRGGLYLLCNDTLLRVRIRRKVGPVHLEEQNTHTGQDLKLPYVYPNIYGDGLKIILLTKQKIEGGKNFNIFRSLALSNRTTVGTGLYDYYLQVFPLPHSYKRLMIPPHDKDFFPIKKEELQVSTTVLPLPSFDGPDTKHKITICPENEKPGALWTTSCNNSIENAFFGDSDHGTACCVSLNLGADTKDVLVGISHKKTTSIVNPWWRRDIYKRYHDDSIPGRRYLSRFIAYDSTPPFDIVARSGWFCLGFANEWENSTFAGRNKQYKLDLFNDTYDCPVIHFASGIVEFVGDPSKVVISYGVNDCHPRMMVVHKEEIARRLQGV